MKDTSLEVLRHRLASGEISLEEYRLIKDELTQSSEATQATSWERSATPDALPLAEIDGIEVFDAFLRINGTPYDFESVTSVRGGGCISSVNLVPLDRWASLSVTVEGQEPIRILENRVIFGGRRQGRIVKTYSCLASKTLKFRSERLYYKVRDLGSVTLGKDLRSGSNVVAMANGILRCGDRTMRLAVAKDQGRLVHGIQLVSLGASRGSDPSLFVVTESPSKSGWIPNDAIRFYSTEEDEDAVFQVLNWIADRSR